VQVHLLGRARVKEHFHAPLAAAPLVGVHAAPHPMCDETDLHRPTALTSTASRAPRGGQEIIPDEPEAAIVNGETVRTKRAYLQVVRKRPQLERWSHVRPAANVLLA
jgi:hypothetical protein